jgi:hypothetical protein
MLESKGTKRTLSAVFAILAVAAEFIPVVAPFKEIFIQIAGVMGVAGIGHAAVVKSRK